ncbi:MAG: hypothetical protein CEN91_587 [Candidatus Berkelbacteria bacterium Licking1014_85]|uniref:Uncharacterized protein n=1 Tax=Candidatus Berkelbacteria bacterium Licking1014_85 TaxID=2017148 RepID=A0A554LG66_9BACT|nr:MAG: hypothetical protein CEN91_587 [Candidatus Berkelbacteria bacterium Licking1014_85]
MKNLFQFFKIGIFGIILAVFMFGKSYARVLVSTQVLSKVDVEKSQVISDRNDLSVILKDKQNQPIAGKYVRFASQNILTGANGIARLDLKLNNNLQTTKIIADGINDLGEFGFLPKKSFFNIIFPQTKAETKGIELSPATINIPINANESKTEVISVTNNTDIAQSFEAYLSDYQLLDDSTAALKFLLAGSLPDSLKDIVSFDPRRFDLSPNEKQKITIRISPKATNQGKYKGAIFVSQIVENNQNPDSTRLAISTKVGSLIGVEVLNSKNESASIDDIVRQSIFDWWHLYLAGISVIIIVIIVFSRRSNRQKKLR